MNRKKKLKHRIPHQVAIAAAGTNPISPQFAEFPSGVAPEATPYLISFAKYNEHLCQIDMLSGNKAKRAISVFKKIGTKVRKTGDFINHGIDRIPIRPAGEYLKLYSRLERDIELLETKLPDRARIFYFDPEVSIEDFLQRSPISDFLITGSLVN